MLSRFTLPTPVQNYICKRGNEPWSLGTFPKFFPRPTRFLSLSLSLSHARSWHFLVVQLTVRDHLYVRKEVKFCRVCQGQGPQGMYCKNGPRSAIFLLCSSFRNPEVHEVQKFYILLRSNEVIPVQCSDGTSPQFRRGSCPSEDSHRC